MWPLVCGMCVFPGLGSTFVPHGVEDFQEEKGKKSAACDSSETTPYSNDFGSAHWSLYLKFVILVKNPYAKRHLWKLGPLVCPGVTPGSIFWILPERRVQLAAANRVFPPNADFCPTPPSCHTYVVHLLPALIHILLCFPSFLEMLHTQTYTNDTVTQAQNKTFIHEETQWLDFETYVTAPFMTKSKTTIYTVNAYLNFFVWQKVTLIRKVLFISSSGTLGVISGNHLQGLKIYLQMFFPLLPYTPGGAVFTNHQQQISCI